MKRILFALLVASLFTACKKDDTIKIPVHTESLNWFVNTTRYFTDGNGDTAYFISADTTIEWYSNLVDIPTTDGFWDSQIKTQDLVIDTNVTYSVRISAGLDSGYVRNDRLEMVFAFGGEQLEFTGFAHPKNQINLNSGMFYMPVWEINGQTFNDVYVKEFIGTNHLVAYINAEYNLVAYFVNGQLFSLDNIK